MLLLEKAVAKWVGSYYELKSGRPSWALQLLLGPRKLIFFERHGAKWKQVQAAATDDPAMVHACKGGAKARANPC